MTSGDVVVTVGLIIIAYLVGGIPVGVLAGRMRGVDIRQYGSGNIGASNVFRTLGAKTGVVVWILDVLKGFAPVALSGIMAGRVPWSAGPELFLSLVAGAAVLGHCFSPYLKLSGGRGVATSLGTLLALDWRVGSSVFVVWLIVLLVTRYISLASILAAASAVLFFALYSDSEYYLVLGFVLAILVIERHRPNIGRLVAGAETRIGQKAKGLTEQADDKHRRG